MPAVPERAGKDNLKKGKSGMVFGSNTKTGIYTFVKTEIHYYENLPTFRFCSSFFLSKKRE